MTEILELRGLGKDYGSRRAVGAVDLDVHAGEIFGLLGPNGAGKTTTISMACGVVTPSRGSVRIAGKDLRDEPFAARSAVGFVPQDLALYEELTPVQNLTFFGRLYGLAGADLARQIAWALDVAGLADRAGEPARSFSGGMKRRLNLAAGLVHRPRLLVLDEPTVGVDPQSRRHIFDTIRALHAAGTTVVYTSHYMQEVEALCDRIAVMDGGAVIAVGTMDELVAAHGGAGVDAQIDGDLDAARTAAAAFGEVVVEGDVLHVVPTGPLAPVVAAIESVARIRRLSSREADLETVFLTLTGHSLRDH
jgi:ABC-2 type transport system ATP-binding protein